MRSARSVGVVPVRPSTAPVSEREVVNGRTAPVPWTATDSRGSATVPPSCPWSLPGGVDEVRRRLDPGIVGALS
jgi:hypothetical protein